MEGVEEEGKGKEKEEAESGTAIRQRYKDLLFIPSHSKQAHKKRGLFLLSSFVCLFLCLIFLLIKGWIAILGLPTLLCILTPHILLPKLWRFDFPPPFFFNLSVN